MSTKKFRGGSLLIPYSDQRPIEDLCGDDALVISHPIMNKAFAEVIARHSALHPIALVSLCTATRPYSKSSKWSVYKKLFGPFADLIIMSNGGIVPIEFEDQFPYPAYDGKDDEKHNGLYHDVLVGRLIRFFTAHRYRSVLFNTPYKQRNRAACKIAGKALKAMGAVEEYVLLPTDEQYNATLADDYGGQGFRYCPVLHPDSLLPVARRIGEWAGAEIYLQYRNMAELNVIAEAFQSTIKD